MTRRFTGWHMTAIIVSFFAVVITVNMVMAVMATRTFGGTVVDNSYVASQAFNAWLNKAHRQETSGIDARISLDGHRRLNLTIRSDRAVQGVVPTGQAEHPLGRADDVPLHFQSLGEGHYRSATPVPPGRWIVRLSLTTRSGEARLLEYVQ